MVWQKHNYIISDDQNLLNIEFIHDYLSGKSYWAANIPFEIVKRSVAGSLCFGVYDREKQIGFARVVTDQAAFAYLGDVFIDEMYHGKGLSKWLMETMINHPLLQGLRRWMLSTKDAHGLYEKYGFTSIEEPSRFMHRHNPHIYTQDSGK
jgi:GNAT superfamily N-acetyltransferase